MFLLVSRLGPLSTEPLHARLFGPTLGHRPPERVTEYPDADDLPGDLRKRDQVADDDAPHLHWSSPVKVTPRLL